MGYDVVANKNENWSEWIEAHQTGIGASEIAAVMGQHRFLSRLHLWAIKTGRMAPDDLSDNESVMWGNLLEDKVLEELARRTGRDVEPNGELLRSQDHPWMLATTDGWSLMHTVPVEAKTTGGVHAKDWVDGAPGYNVLQLQQQMAVTDTAMATTAVLVGTYGFRMFWQDVERDPKLIDEMIAWGDWFWDYVQRDEPPPVADDAAQDDVGDTIAQLWSEPKVGGSTIPLPPDADEWAAKLEEAKSMVKHWTFEKDRWQHELELAIGENENGLLPDGSGYSLRAQTRYNLKLAEGEERPLPGKISVVRVDPTISSFRVLRAIKGIGQ